MTINFSLARESQNFQYPIIQFRIHFRLRQQIKSIRVVFVCKFNFAKFIRKLITMIPKREISLFNLRDFYCVRTNSDLG